MRRVHKHAWLLAALVAAPSVAVSIPASAAESAAPLAVETFGYPDAAKILAEQNLTLKAGDGNIRLADCASEAGLVRIFRQVATPAEVCFKVTGATGYLALETPDVINIKGDSHAIKATLTADGATSSVDIKKNDWTPVGEADNTTGNKPSVLLELTAADGAATTPSAPALPSIGSITVGQVGRVGSRGCTATLVDPLWVLTSAGCFTDNPASLAAGTPTTRSTFTAGGHAVDIAQLVPRTDRDAVLARLAAPLFDLAPAKLAATAAATGAGTKVSGYGRTATTWWNGARTTDQAVTAVSATGLDLAPATGAAPVCAGDSGAPVLNAAGEIAGVVSRAWQGTCLGTAASETRTAANAVRTDDLGSWTSTTVAAAGAVVQPGTKLTSGQSITGPDLKLTMRTDGNLVVTHKQVGGGVLWSSNTAGNNGAWAYVQTDGNFVVYRADGNPANGTGAIWASNTWGQNGAFLKLQDDGNVSLVKADGSAALWSTGTARLDPKVANDTRIKPGQWFQSQSAVVEMQADGNLVRYSRSDGTPTWNTNTAGNNGAWAYVQPDGNFVVYRADGNPANGTGAIWGSNTWGQGGAFLKLHDDGSLLLYKKDATETVANSIWSAGTFRPESKLVAGQQVYTKTTRLAMQWDGDLVLYRLSDNSVMWHSNTAGNGGAFLKVQNDGNVVVYSSDGTRPLWNTGTFWSSGSYFKAQDDGNLVVYKAGGGEGIGNAIWATNTFA